MTQPLTRLHHRWCLRRHLSSLPFHQRDHIPEALTQWLKWGREKRRLEAHLLARDNLRWGPNLFYIALSDATSTYPLYVEARTALLADNPEQERQAQEDAKVWIQEIQDHFTHHTPLPHHITDPWLVQQVKRALQETPQP